MLRDDGDESLHAAQDGTVDHHGARFEAVDVLAAVLEVEPLGELEVELDGRALIRAAEAVPHADVDLGAVESAVAGIDLPFPGVVLVERLFQLLVRREVSYSLNRWYEDRYVHPRPDPRS
jgi:hypothetical protein